MVLDPSSSCSLYSWSFCLVFNDRVRRPPAAAGWAPFSERASRASSWSSTARRRLASWGCSWSDTPATSMVTHLRKKRPWLQNGMILQDSVQSRLGESDMS
jgi:hypothetical protein